uniref:Uncharacterized protein TCIL3000_11_16930 n=1 Tax=Trypanosoma congolense (strain IL3000) TaxID=1068625 RepID=G0V3F6_TRYCI|nr:unnamed protein product [Trypanosoma congolense IL3000]
MSAKVYTSGYFSDLQYWFQREKNVFLDLLASSKTHRLPESMMLKADTEVYYTDEDSKLHYLLSKAGGVNDSCKSVSGVLDVIPPLLSTVPLVGAAQGGWDGGCFVITASASALDMVDCITDTGANRPSCTTVSLDIRGIDEVWQSLIHFILGDNTKGDDIVYVVPNVDVYLYSGHPFGEFLFSIFVLVVSSIFHHFSSFPDDSTQMRLGRVKVLLTFSRDNGKYCCVDDVHLFIENKLRLSVDRKIKIDAGLAVCREASLTELPTFFSQDEWIERVTEVVTNAHDQLCDAFAQEDGGSLLQCILLIIPDKESLVDRLKKQLYDSYTSTPIEVVTNLDNVSDLLAECDGRTLITVLCTQQGIEEQILRPEHERCFKYLKVRAVIFGEGEEKWWIDILHGLLLETPSLIYLPFPMGGEHKDTTTNEKNWADKYIQEGMNIVLWLYRRFRLRLGKKGFQPVLQISEHLFISRFASRFFDMVTDRMCLAGLVTRTQDADKSKSYLLDIRGRLLSYRFRLPYISALPEMNPLDVNCIFWCCALRQSRAVALKLISNSHKFSYWVDDAITRFCLRHRIKFTEEMGDDGELLVKTLCFMSKPDDTVSRVLSFLRHPMGRRTPIPSRRDAASLTLGRGWFDQTPSTSERQSLPQGRVNIYCYPSHNELCEIHFGDHVLQCPLDISYALISTHIAIHTVMRNNAIFLESTSEFSRMPLVPIPLAILRSPTFKSIASGLSGAPVGTWLDGCVGANPPPSDPMELASLMGRTFSLLGLCETDRLRRRCTDAILSTKRPKHEGLEFKVPSEAEADVIRGFVKAAKKMGRDNAEKNFRMVKGFAFLDPLHESHAYYLYLMKQ